MLGSLTIRLFAIDDLERVLAIEKHSFGRDAWSKRIFLDYFRTSPELFLVAMLGRRLAGYSITSCESRQAELVSLAVNLKDRRRGVARALLTLTIRELRKQGSKTWWLMVETTNQAAIQFYEKFGFVRTRIARHYYAGGRDAWRMRLALQPVAARGLRPK